MKLISFQFRNHKSFADSGKLRFSSGFNVIVGQNNSGKSALLQGISLRFGDIPHLSLNSKRTTSTPVKPQSKAELVVGCSGEELRNILLNRGAQFRIPVQAGQGGINEERFRRTLQDLFSASEVQFSLLRNGNGNIETSRVPSFSDFQVDQHDMVCQANSDRTEFVFQGATSAGDRSHEIGAHVGRAFVDQLYFFHAERLRVSESGFGHSPVLRPDAGNLPEVLAVLQSNSGRFNRFNQYVSQIFPTIQRVSVRANTSNQLQIAIWTVDPATEREDLAMSLADSGTGVGQVLAILYVAVTSPPPHSRTIIIDEPNSFLHPGAAKKLLEILCTFSHLQFVISTHSPEIIRTAQANTLSVVRWYDGASTVEQVEVNRVDSLQLVLRDIGVSLSDVFGADRVLWVEGPTEELCFPLLIDQLLGRTLIGIAITAVLDTGRLTSRRPSAELIWQIYSKISTAGALMPPALAFLFDREGRTETERNDIVRRSQGQVHFLPRRMYENYLLSADAISEVLDVEAGLGGETVLSRVQNWLNEHSDEFLPPTYRGIPVGSADWFREIDGASLLDTLISELTENQFRFDKVRHSYQLTQWLIINNPEALKELSDYLEHVLSGAVAQ